MENNTVRDNLTADLVEEDQISYLARTSFISCMAFIALTGIPGNITVLIVLTRFRTKSSTDYLLLTTAYSDLFSATVNTTGYILRYQSHIWEVLASGTLCRLHSFSLYLTNTSSTLLLAAIAFNRHRKTSKMLTTDPPSTLTNAKRQCFGIVCLSLMFSSAFPFTITLDADSKTCIQAGSYSSLSTCLQVILACIFLFMFIVVIICYTRISIMLHQHHARMSKKQTINGNSGMTQKTSDGCQFSHGKCISELPTKTKESTMKLEISQISQSLEENICPTDTRKCVKIIPRMSGERYEKNALSANTPGKDRQMTDRTTLMLFFVTMIYIGTWIINWSTSAYIVITGSPKSGAFLIANHLYIINCMTNPVFYPIMSSRYRNKARELFCSG